MKKEADQEKEFDAVFENISKIVDKSLKEDDQVYVLVMKNGNTAVISRGISPINKVGLLDMAKAREINNALGRKPGTENVKALPETRSPEMKMYG